jgi:hypothetical protein
MTLGDDGRRAMADWAGGHHRGDRGTHEYSLAEVGLDAGRVRERFSFYLDRFDPK